MSEHIPGAMAAVRLMEDRDLIEIEESEDRDLLATIITDQVVSKTAAERDRLREALEAIGERERARRQGGPAPEDLESLDDALAEAVDIACAALSGTAPSEAEKLREINGELVAALEGVLAFEQARATDLHGLSDCGCMAYSRESENAYENHKCPHQKARAALSGTAPSEAEKLRENESGE